MDDNVIPIRRHVDAPPSTPERDVLTVFIEEHIKAHLIPVEDTIDNRLDGVISIDHLAEGIRNFFVVVDRREIPAVSSPSPRGMYVNASPEWHRETAQVTSTAGRQWRLAVLSLARWEWYRKNPIGPDREN